MSDHDADTCRRCDFCRLPCPLDTVTATYDGVTYEFCSPACEAALASSEGVFTEYHGARRFDPGVVGLGAALPEGMPRDSFVLVAGQTGTRDAAVHAELVWRTLQRDEPAVVVAFLEPPAAVVQDFLKLEWNVLPYLQTGQLHVLDCFTYRRDDRGRNRRTVDDWNAHVEHVVADATTAVRDPSDTGELANKLDGVLDDHAMLDEGLVLVDSLTELGTMLQPVQAYDLVKSLRADVCKGRFVPIVAGATFAGEGDAFPHDLDYVVDGVVDLELNGSIVEDTLLKRVRVRKMNGVLAIPQWRAYEYTSQLGMVTFDPAEEVRDDDATEAPEDVAGSDDDSGTDGDDATPRGGRDAADAGAASTDGGDPPTADGEEQERDPSGDADQQGPDASRDADADE
jgi:KaiC/GvpD/RAD55 family RecA-like ATPase